MKDPFINGLDDEPDVLTASNEGSGGVFSSYQIDWAAFYEPAVHMKEFFSQPSGLPPVEDFSEKRQKKGTSGEEKDSDGWDDLRYVSQMPLYLLLLLLRPLFICVPGFHKKLHQSLDRKDFHQDGFLINNDHPSKILFDHRRTTHNSIFLAFTFSAQFRKCSH